MIQQRDTSGIKNSGMADSSAPTKSSVIFMPLSSLPDGFRVKNGDIIIEGDCPITADEQGYGEACASPERLTVLSVAKRNFGSLPMRHLEVQCV